MTIKIHGGTARDGEPALCLSCRYASIVFGTSTRDTLIRCSRVEAPIAFKVTSCTEYLSRQHPSLYHMEDIAWILRTDTKRKQVGFVRSQDLTPRERLFVEDE
jgi:hypothetical protein